MRCHLGTIEKHAISISHKKSINAATHNRKIGFARKETISDSLKKAELELAVAASCHFSTLAIDHFGEIIKRNAKGSVMEKLRLHRTKCSALITSVIAPSLKQELIGDVSRQKFSLLLDESTDVSVTKLLAICIRYFSSNSEKIETVFWDCTQ